MSGRASHAPSCAAASPSSACGAHRPPRPVVDDDDIGRGDLADRECRSAKWRSAPIPDPGCSCCRRCRAPSHAPAHPAPPGRPAPAIPATASCLPFPFQRLMSRLLGKLAAHDPIRIDLAQRSPLIVSRRRRHRRQVIDIDREAGRIPERLRRHARVQALHLQQAILAARTRPAASPRDRRSRPRSRNRAFRRMCAGRAGAPEDHPPRGRHQHRAPRPARQPHRRLRRRGRWRSC